MSTRRAMLFGAVLGLSAGVVAAWYYHGRDPASDNTRAVRSPTRATVQPPVTAQAGMDEDPVLRRVVRSGPMARPRDFFRVIVRPKYITAAQASYAMSDEEIVLGLEVGGQPRAYPINYLNDHEMVREEIDGLPLLVTW
jgi:hypothetical protein